VKAPSLKHLSLGLFLASILTGSVHARTPEIVKQKANHLNQQVQRNAQRLSGLQLAELEQELDRAIETALGSPRPRPPIPIPGPLPPRPIPANECKLLGQGKYGYSSYNYRIALNGEAIEGTDNLQTALSRLDRLVQDGMCSPAPATECSLGAQGKYIYSSYNFLVKMNGEAIAGTDNIDVALSTIDQLEAARVCRPSRALEACQLLGRGKYGYSTYTYRVGLGGAVLMGTDNYNTLVTFMNKLRNARICH